MSGKVPGRTMAPEDRIRSSWWLESGGEARRRALNAIDLLDAVCDEFADAVQVVVSDLRDHIVRTGHGVDLGKLSAVAVSGHLGKPSGNRPGTADFRFDKNVCVDSHDSNLLSRGAGTTMSGISSGRA